MVARLIISVLNFNEMITKTVFRYKFPVYWDTELEKFCTVSSNFRKLFVWNAINCVTLCFQAPSCLYVFIDAVLLGTTYDTFAKFCFILQSMGVLLLLGICRILTTSSSEIALSINQALLSEPVRIICNKEKVFTINKRFCASSDSSKKKNFAQTENKRAMDAKRLKQILKSDLVGLMLTVVILSFTVTAFVFPAVILYLDVDTFRFICNRLLSSIEYSRLKLQLTVIFRILLYVCFSIQAFSVYRIMTVYGFVFLHVVRCTCNIVKKGFT